MRAVWQQLCRFATLYLLEFGQLYNQIPCRLSHAELADLETRIDLTLWHEFTHAVFRGEQSIHASEFAQRCLDSANYIFDVQLLRVKIIGCSEGTDIPSEPVHFNNHAEHYSSRHEDVIFLSNSPPKLHSYSHFEHALPFHHTHVLSFDQMLSQSTTLNATHITI
jgi:hypothetical protein